MQKPTILCLIPRKMFCSALVMRCIVNQPVISLCGNVRKWCDTVRYLGYDINCRDRDSEELSRRRRELYARANLIQSRFGACSYNVKIHLFKTFFSTVYCCSLWVPVWKAILDKVRTAYNDAFRIIFGYSRRSSASSTFCENSVRDFYAIRRCSA